jgi:hypothetical protein
VAIVGALIAVSASYALHWINKKEEATSKSEVSTVPQESPKILNGAGGKPISPDIIEGSIFIETKTVARPPIYPPEGHLNVLYLYPHTFAAGSPSQLGVSSVFGMPGAPMPWPKSDSISWDFCTLLEITNDTAFPLRELTIPVHVAYGMEPNIHHLDMTLATVRIDPGSNNRRMIYVVNLAPEGGTMVMGTVATSMK